jgi:hypothetical protein
MPRPQVPFEQRKGSVMGIEHHLLRLARIGPHEQHPAVAKPDVGDLHDHRHAAQQDDFVAPIELISFPRRKAQRHIGRCRRLPAMLGPPPGIVAAVSQLLASGFGGIAFQQRIELSRPSPELRS